MHNAAKVQKSRLELGRESFRAKAWGDAYARLSESDRSDPLQADDLERLATAAYLIGRDEETMDVLARAHKEHLAAGGIEGAARSAFWVGFIAFNRGEIGRGSGWLTRAQRLLDEHGIDSVLHGYMLLPGAIRSAREGNAAAAHDLFSKTAAIAERFADRDLLAMARHGQGRSLIAMANIPEGLQLLDEAMVGITAGEVSPMMAGHIYCSVIEACNDVYDFRRAHEWTSALSRWCESQPDLVPYRGPCLVRRAELMQLHGEWRGALEEAQRACEHLTGRPRPTAGWASYQRAELHRLRGEFAEAEEAFTRASELGRKPQPGLSLLRLAQGHIETAVASIRNAIEETDARSRWRVLAAAVDIFLAAHDIRSATAAADELGKLMRPFEAVLPRAVAAYARGAVQLAKGETRAALADLRTACTGWCSLDAPYEAARAQMLIALACRALGDDDSANMEFGAARRAFTHLGAMPDLARVETLWSSPAAKVDTHGLSARELEVLRLLATGKTNRAIAGELFISEKTVARHVSNIFTKLDLSSRAAATAYAYEHRLV